MYFFSLTLHPPWALASSFSFMIIFTDGRTLGTSDQLVVRPLPKHKTTQTQNKHIHTPNIHALIRTHDLSVQASEDSSCLRPLSFYVRIRSSFHEAESFRSRHWDGQATPHISKYLEVHNCVNKSFAKLFYLETDESSPNFHIIF
jgi:hypothetical protein